MSAAVEEKLGRCVSLAVAQRGRCVISLAACLNDLEMVKLLVLHSANVNLADFVRTYDLPCCYSAAFRHGHTLGHLSTSFQ